MDLYEYIIKIIPALTLILMYKIASKLRSLQIFVNMNFDSPVGVNVGI